LVKSLQFGANRIHRESVGIQMNIARVFGENKDRSARVETN